MKKIFALILVLTMVLTLLCACSKKSDTSAADTYLSMAQDFLDKSDVDSAIEILNKGFAETKDSRLSEKLVEIYAQRGNSEATEPSSAETLATAESGTETVTTTPPTTKPVSTTPATTKPKTTTPPTTKPTTATTAVTKNTQSASSNVTPEFKKAMDSYEKFFDEYVAFMKAFEKSNDVLDLLDDYNKYLKQYAETVQKMSEIKTDKLSAADYAYYFEVNGRITKKLLEVATTPSAPNTAATIKPVVTNPTTQPTQATNSSKTEMQLAIEEAKRYKKQNSDVILCNTDLYDYLKSLGYSEDICEEFLVNNPVEGFYNGAAMYDYERITMFHNQGYSRDAIIEFYLDVLPYGSAEFLVDECLAGTKLTLEHDEDELIFVEH